MEIPVEWPLQIPGQGYSLGRAVQSKRRPGTFLSNYQRNCSSDTDRLTPKGYDASSSIS